MGTYDTRGGTPISPNIEDPPISALEHAVLPILEDAGVPTEICDRICKLIDEAERAHDTDLRSQLTRAREAAIEEAAKAVCSLCRDGIPLESQSLMFNGWHFMGFSPKDGGSDYEECAAEAIRSLLGKES